MGVQLTLGRTLSVASFAAAIMCILSLGPAIETCPAADTTLKVGIIGDQTGASNIQQAYKALATGVDILRRERVKLVLHVGDICEIEHDDTAFQQEFEQATRILDRLSVAWYLTPGDHDINPRGDWQPATNNRSMETLFLKLYEQHNHGVKNHAYYSFSQDGYHFVALYSLETLRVDPRWGNVFLSSVSDCQFKWLSKDLERNKHANGIVVFTHHPLWYNWCNWARIHNLLKQYPVSAVIAGHYHYDQDEGELDGIRYIVVGATGGDVKPSNRDGGKAWHVTRMTLNGRKATFKLLDLEDGKELGITPRRDMDRVQAIDSMLFDLNNFGDRNPLWSKNGQIVSSCEDSKPARIKLFSVGNPIDVPVHVLLTFFGPNVKIEDPEFLDESCHPPPDGLKCTLQPGKRIAFSNTSSVALAWNCNLPKVLWQARVVPKVQVIPKPDQQLGVKVRVSFQGVSGPFFLERSGSTHVEVCPCSSARRAQGSSR